MSYTDLFNCVLVFHRRSGDPPTAETVENIGMAAAQRSGRLWCREARVLVGPGVSRAPHTVDVGERVVGPHPGGGFPRKLERLNAANREDAS